MTLHPFEELIYHRFTNSILLWDLALRQEVYALCLLYGSGWSADEQGRELAFQGWVALSYNTLSHFQEEVERIRTEEPKWRNAFWLYDQTAQAPLIPDYGISPNDAEMNLRDSWCASVNLKPDGVDGTERPTYNEPQLYQAIAALCGRVARKLHEDDVTTKLFGKPLPVIIETDDWSNEALAATQASNPSEVLGDYLQWMRWRRHPFSVY